MRLRELRAEAVQREPRGPLRSEPMRPRVGEILKTVKGVLLQADRPLPVKEIHASCERALGRPVVYSTVKGYLRDKRRSKTFFRRIRHGWYELIE